MSNKAKAFTKELKYNDPIPHVEEEISVFQSVDEKYHALLNELEECPVNKEFAVGEYIKQLAYIEGE